MKAGATTGEKWSKAGVELRGALFKGSGGGVSKRFCNLGGGGGGGRNLLLREPLWVELCVGIGTFGSVGASVGGGVSKPGGWPGV